MWTPLVTCPTGTSSSGQCGKSGSKRCRLTCPCKRLTPLTAPLPRIAKIGHVETLRRVVRVLAAQGQQIADGDAKFFLGVPTEVLLDEGRSEAIKARGHRRVGGEKVPRSRDGQRDFKRLPGLVHESPGSFQNGERRVPFIQVTDFRLDAERVEQPPSADSQHHFLL